MMSFIHSSQVDTKLLLLLLLPLLACTKAPEPDYSHEGYPLEEEEVDPLSPNYTRQLISGEAPPPTPEEAQEILDKAWGSWFYGHGMGKTAINIGTIVLFPPYALYLLGNAGIEFAGYEPLYITDALPEDAREVWNTGYNAVSSVPGRLNATIFDEEFQDGK